MLPVKRTTFCAYGTHPLMGLVCGVLIDAGYIWEQDEVTDFSIIGEGVSLSSTSSPCIILSSSDVYTCLDSNRKVVEVPFSEHDALVVPSTNACLTQIKAILHESLSRSQCKDHAVLRLFDVYGPGCAGLVTSYLYAKNYAAEHSEYRKISQLFVEDFTKLFLSFVQVFIQDKVRGIYNVGSDEVVTLKHLIELIDQSKTGSKKKLDITVKQTNDFVNFYCVPDLTRIKAVTGWLPKVSLRKGIFLNTQESKWSVQYPSLVE